MARKNSYCGLYNKPDGTYLYLSPSNDGGTKLHIEDIDEYMAFMNMEYDKIAVNRLLQPLLERKDLKISPDQMQSATDEVILVRISEDRQYAIGKFYPPTPGGGLLNKDDIVSKLVQSGVKFGVTDLNIDLFLTDRQYCTEFVLAKAMEPVEGKNAEIIYYFNTDLTKKPAANEDGSVDFHKLDTISPVHRGDMLARLIPADEGKPGIDVCGGLLRQGKVQHKILKHGNKIHLSDDKLEMFSEVDGHASLVDDKVFVSDTLEIPTDVGPSTGDINFEGNVQIKGSVVNGYTVNARGDIIVDGVVEGATLISGGQIILKRGIQGGMRGVLRAGSNIVAKFIESAEVVSGGYIQTESIMHSNVSARSDITVGGKRGFITGGEIRSGSMIQAKTAGNTMGTRTLLEVGVEPALIEEYRKLEKDIPSMEQEIEKIDQLLAAYAKKLKAGEKLDARIVIQVKESARKKEQIKADLTTGKLRFVALHDEMEQNQNGTVKVLDIIYPGCRIIISNVSYFVKSEVQHSRFVRDKADIKILSI